ncbi:MAG: class I SAM-dependent methyltransferase [Candidatus Micrarchaeales archaeon]|nr:class I SAM-dependent methyltransferase [Candidatus Micrarchaeales archaeon]
MEYRYSPEFKQLIQNEELVKSFLTGSHVTGFDFKLWEKRRSFIADAIKKDGTILDIGCANGLLLRSLQEWSEHRLVPFGIDIEPKSIEKAKALFPANANNFVLLPIEELDKIGEKGLPDKFDFIYWHVWDSVSFEGGEEKWVKSAVEHMLKGGRLILGFYDSRESNSEKIETLESLGFKIDGVEINKSGEEIICWIDRP